MADDKHAALRSCAVELFRNTKYRPDYPHRGFATVDDARQWLQVFVSWYNEHHLHRGIRYVTPTARHTGQDRDVLAQRQAVYEAAKARRPERWRGPTRNWTPIGAVWLNPSKDDERSIDQRAA